MAAPLNTCTTIEQRGVRFLWAKNMDTAKDIHKEMLPVWAVGSISVWISFAASVFFAHNAQRHAVLS
jgi:hypothetical protein